MKLNNHTRSSTAALSALLVASVIGGGAALAATTMQQDKPDASIIAFNQKPKGDGISLRYVFLPEKGAVEIFAVDRAGKLEKALLGKVSLGAGDHRDVAVQLKPAPQKGARLRAVAEVSGKLINNAGDAPERTFNVL